MPRTTVAVFDSRGHQAEPSGRLRCTWWCDCRIGATRLGRGRALRALRRHRQMAHRVSR
jgi:hypothetical protein